MTNTARKFSNVLRTVANLFLQNWLRLLLKFGSFAIVALFAMPFFYRISHGLYQNLITSSISFNLDTIFLNWNTTFPAVTVCEIYNGEKIWDLSEQYYGEGHDLHIDDFISEIVFFRGTCTTCALCERMECPRNFTELMARFRSKCAELIINCSYTNRYFNCCDEFRPIHTEYGICFAFNSNQAHKLAQLQYANNRHTGPGDLKFDASADIQLHIHPPIDIPFPFSEGIIRETLLLGNFKEIIINVMEVYNHDSVYKLSLDQRRCRLSRERTQWGSQLGIYAFYSFPSCTVECTLMMQLERCNCSNHLLAPAVKSSIIDVPICDYRGLICLTENYEELQMARKSCNCMSSCEEPEYNIVYNSADDEDELDLDVTQVRVALVELPTQRYVRRVTKTQLDFLISVGGIVGLFFNASILGVVEALFLLKEFNWQKFLAQFWNHTN